MKLQMCLVLRLFYGNYFIEISPIRCDFHSFSFFFSFSLSFPSFPSFLSFQFWWLLLFWISYFLHFNPNFHPYLQNLNIISLIKEVANRSVRPPINPLLTPQPFAEMLRACWAQSPKQRPKSFELVNTAKILLHSLNSAFHRSPSLKRSLSLNECTFTEQVRSLFVIYLLSFISTQLLSRSSLLFILINFWFQLRYGRYRPSLEGIGHVTEPINTSGYVRRSSCIRILPPIFSTPFVVNPHPERFTPRILVHDVDVIEGDGLMCVPPTPPAAVTVLY
jgi:hypothetical protein